MFIRQNRVKCWCGFNIGEDYACVQIIHVYMWVHTGIYTVRKQSSTNVHTRTHTHTHTVHIVYIIMHTLYINTNVHMFMWGVTQVSLYSIITYWWHVYLFLFQSQCLINVSGDITTVTYMDQHQLTDQKHFSSTSTSAETYSVCRTIHVPQNTHTSLHVSSSSWSAVKYAVLEHLASANQN